MKIYWKSLLWNYTKRYWWMWKFRKSKWISFYATKQIWNSRQKKKYLEKLNNHLNLMMKVLKDEQTSS